MGAWLSACVTTLLEPLARLYGKRGHGRKRSSPAAQERLPDHPYAAKALYPELLDPRLVDSWFLPSFLAAISAWRRSGDPRDVELLRLPGVQLEAPGVVSFDCLRPEFCSKLLAEAQHYRDSGLPQKPPNSMNNYGLLMDDLGLNAAFSEVLHGYLLGVGARLFGKDAVRATHLGAERCATQDWGGSSLDRHYCFIVRYDPREDVDLDMHVDDCDVTFNFGLSESSEFAGSDLAFCGMKGSAGVRKLLHKVGHIRGRCVVHSGKHRHGALPIQSGTRSSLIMWTKSESYRWTDEYQLQAYGPSAKELDAPDLVCLSRTHDWDYERMAARLSGAAEPEEAAPPPQLGAAPTGRLPIRSRSVQAA